MTSRNLDVEESSSSMSEMRGRQRSAVVFGARNLGRAVIEALVAEGWAVAGWHAHRPLSTGLPRPGPLRYRQTSLILRACTPRLAR